MPVTLSIITAKVPRCIEFANTTKKMAKATPATVSQVRRRTRQRLRHAMVTKLSVAALLRTGAAMAASDIIRPP